MASKTPLGLAELAQPWENSGAVATKPGGLGNGYKAGSMFLDLQSHEIDSNPLPEKADEEWSIDLCATKMDVLRYCSTELNKLGQLWKT